MIKLKSGDAMSVNQYVIMATCIEGAASTASVVQPIGSLLMGSSLRMMLLPRSAIAPHRWWIQGNMRRQCDIPGFRDPSSQPLLAQFLLATGCLLPSTGPSDNGIIMPLNIASSRSMLQVILLRAGSVSVSRKEETHPSVANRMGVTGFTEAKR